MAYIPTMVPVLLLALAHHMADTPCPDLGLVQNLCPVDCDCFCRGKRSDVTVQCSYREKLSIPPEFPPSTTALYISGNPLHTLDSDSFSNKNLSHVRTLDLSYCALTSLGAGVFQPMKKLHTVYLHNNELTKRAVRTLLLGMKDSPHVHLHLKENRFNCPSLKNRYSKWKIVCGKGEERDTSTPTQSTTESSTTVNSEVTMTTAEMRESTTTSSSTTQSYLAETTTPRIPAGEEQISGNPVWRYIAWGLSVLVLMCVGIYVVVHKRSIAKRGGHLVVDQHDVSDSGNEQ